MIHDKLTDGVQTHITTSLKDLENAIAPVSDALETLRVLAPPLMIGLEVQFAALEELRLELMARWAFYLTHGGWAGSEEAAQLPARASAKQAIGSSSDNK